MDRGNSLLDVADGTLVIVARRLHYTHEDYLITLAMSQVKLEYCDGDIFAMAGGTPAHAELAASMIRILGNAVQGRCRVASSALKIRIDATDLFAFPDVTVTCGEPLYAAMDRNSLVNPTLLVEVTSPSTEEYDRGAKLWHYEQCPSLRAVLIVSHRERRVTLVARTGAAWEEREFGAGDHVIVAAPNLGFPVNELYDGVVLDV